MQSRTVVLSFLGGLGLFLASRGGVAETGSISLRADTGSFSFGAGGELGVTSFTGMSARPVASSVAVSGYLFQTFCLERNEGLTANTPKTWTLGNAAVAGGVGGAVNGSDPISSETAYLLTKFWNGTLSGYDYTLGSARIDSAGNLQAAIWFLEEEYTPTQLSMFPRGQAWVQEAQSAVANGTWSGIGDVRVLTLIDASTGDPEQDVLVIPGTTISSTGLTLTKTASPSPVQPGMPVTYTYVVTNTSSDTVTDLRIVDDNGTPGSTSDDFVVGTAASLGAGQSLTFNVTLVPPTPMCFQINGSMRDVGVLSGETLSDGNVLIRFVQSLDVVDNTYGANSSAGWGGIHTFSSFVGSDRAEFRLKNGAGAVVMDFSVDYISQSSSYPSGYGTLGVTGGDGRMTVGSASDIVSVHTSMTDNLNQSPAFYGYTTDSPPPPNPLWDYHDSYTVVVKGSAFGASGFGSVEVPYVHNSPSKKPFGAIIPVACTSFQLTNTAVATATLLVSGTQTTLSVSASATVVIGTPTSGTSSVDLHAGAVTVKDKKVTIPLTNTGSVAATISGLRLSWPAADKKLTRVRLGNKTLWDKNVSGTTVTLTNLKGPSKDSQISAGATETLCLEFEGKAQSTGYTVAVDLGAGFVVLLQ